MKNIYALIVITIFTVSCRKDKEFVVNEPAKTPTKGMLVEKQTISIYADYSDTLFEIFEYNGDNILRCTTYNSNIWINPANIIEYAISKDSVNYTIFGSSNSVKGCGVYYLQNNCAITQNGWYLNNVGPGKYSYSSCYTYDNNGYLIKTETKSYFNDSLLSIGKSEFEIINGNTVTEKYIANDTCIGWQDYEFDLTTSNTNLEDKIFYWLGKPNNNLLLQNKWYSLYSGGVIPDRIIKYTNILDEHGNLCKTEINEFGSDGSLLPYSRKVYYFIKY